MNLRKTFETKIKFLTEIDKDGFCFYDDVDVILIQVGENKTVSRCRLATCNADYSMTVKT